MSDFNDEDIEKAVEDLIADAQREFAIRNGDQEEFILFSEEDYDKIIEAAIIGALEYHGELSDEEIEDHVMKVLRWAERMAIGHDLVNLMIKGLLMPSVQTEETEAIPIIHFSFSPDVDIEDFKGND